MINITPKKIHQVLSQVALFRQIQNQNKIKKKKKKVFILKISFNEEDFLPLPSFLASLLKILQMKVIHHSSGKECYFPDEWTSL